MKLINNKKSTKPTKGSIYCTKEDMTEIMLVAKKFADHVNQIEVKLVERTQKLAIYVGRLQKEINMLKKAKNL